MKGTHAPLHACANPTETFCHTTGKVLTFAGSKEEDHSHYGNDEGSNRGTECHNNITSDNTSDNITNNATPCACNGGINRSHVQVTSYLKTTFSWSEI